MCELYALFAAPAAGSGDEVQLSVAVGDSCGSDALTTMAVTIADEPTSGGVRVDYANGVLTYEGQSCALAEDVVLRGERGALDCARSGVGAGTDDFVLGLALAFEASFEGEHGIWVDATDGEGRLGWTRVGTFTVEDVYVEDDVPTDVVDEGCACATSTTGGGWLALAVTCGLFSRRRR